VSIAARDLQESTQFYEDVLGLERIPTPRFASPVQWLRVGDLQLHLFLDDSPAPRRHHIGLTIDDFDAAYDAVKARASDSWGWELVELPSKQVQLYSGIPPTT
jgi:catechol 2,3-dioxygenase-like lactoylglutathione lyase family enzyme